MKKTKRNDVNKFIVIKFVITIVLLFVIVIGLFSYVLNLNNKDEGKKVEVSVGELPNIIKKYTEEEALASVRPTIVSVSNKNDEVAEFELYITIDKKSTIDYNYLRVNFDGTTYDLSKLHSYDLGSKFYFEIKEDKVNPKRTNEYDVYIWLDSTYVENNDNKDIFIDFDTLN